MGKQFSGKDKKISFAQGQSIMSLITNDLDGALLVPQLLFYVSRQRADR